MSKSLAGHFSSGSAGLVPVPPSTPTLGLSLSGETKWEVELKSVVMSLCSSMRSLLDRKDVEVFSNMMSLLQQMNRDLGSKSKVVHYDWLYQSIPMIMTRMLDSLQNCLNICREFVKFMESCRDLISKDNIGSLYRNQIPVFFVENKDNFERLTEAISLMTIVQTMIKYHDRPFDVDQKVKDVLQFSEEATMVMFGDTGVGKTSLILTCLDGERKESLDATIGIDSFPPTSYGLHLKDTSGDPSCKSFIDKEVRTCDGIFVVFDTSRPSTLERAVLHLSELKERFAKVDSPKRSMEFMKSSVKSPERPVFLIGHTFGEGKRDGISIEEALKIAVKHHAFYVSLRSEDIDKVKLFFTIAKDVASMEKHFRNEKKNLFFKLASECASERTVTRFDLGFLQKRGYWNTEYKKRWFFVQESKIFYSDSKSSDVKGSIDLLKSSPSIYESDRTVVMLPSMYRTWYLKAESIEDADDILHILNAYRVHLGCI